MFGGFGIPELLLILFIALLVFGPSRIPQMGKAIGSTIKEFKSATKGEDAEAKPDEKK